MKFTKEQLKAIGHREGHLQLIACAGSGKTEVVARRVVNLLDPSASPRFTPANIIAFTFTDKAAAELKQRVIDRVREAHGDIPGDIRSANRNAHESSPSRNISRAALCPGTPVTPPPGCAPEPHRYSPLNGVR